MNSTDADGGAMRATTNLDHQHFEQVTKDKVYFHAEQATEEFEDDGRLETVRLTALQAGEAEATEAIDALGRGLSDLGFVYLVDHGIDPALFAEADRRTRAFFEETPEADKLRFSAQRFGSVNQGYFPYKKSTQAHPDLVQGWVFANRAFHLADTAERDEAYLGQFWPDVADEGFFRSLYQALEPLALPLMRGVLQWFGCPADLYDQRLTDTLCALRLNYYPGLTADDEALGAARLLGHEDVTLFTFLPASPVEGLQVFHRATGKWIRLNPPPGTLIVNAGDYLQRITNNVFQSSTHRVSPPRDPQARKRPRTSFPLFVYLREEDHLEVLPCFEEPLYEPIQALTFHTNITRKFYGEAYRDTGSDA